MENETFKKALDSWEVLIHPFETRITLPRKVNLRGIERFKVQFWVANGNTIIEWEGDFAKFVVITDYLIEVLDEAFSEEAEVRIITQGKVKYWQGLSQCAVWLRLWEILKP